MSVLITRPFHDVGTRYLSSWSQRLIDLAQKKGKKVIDLKGEKANKVELTGRIKKLNPSLVILNGHGDSDLVTGHDNKTLVKLGENESILKSRITYAVSCRSAKLLGSSCAKDQKTTYIGYDDDFIFTQNSVFINRPMQDLRAKPFMEASNQVVISLLKGHKAFDASSRSRNMFKAAYRKLLTSTSDPDSLLDAKCLRWDYAQQVCLGDGEATVK